MDFFSFVFMTQKQDDKDLSGFVAAIKNIEGVPLSSDPRFLGRFLYRKLNHQQTLGFQKWFSFYREYDKENEIPENLSEESAFLDALNLITTLQNNDLDYQR